MERVKDVLFWLLAIPLILVLSALIAVVLTAVILMPLFPVP